MFKDTRQIARNYHHFVCKNVFIISVAIYSKLFPPVFPTIFYVIMKQLMCGTVVCISTFVTRDRDTSFLLSGKFSFVCCNNIIFSITVHAGRHAYNSTKNDIWTLIKDHSKLLI